MPLNMIHHNTAIIITFSAMEQSARENGLGIGNIDFIYSIHNSFQVNKYLMRLRGIQLQ